MKTTHHQLLPQMTDKELLDRFRVMTNALDERGLLRPSYVNMLNIIYASLQKRILVDPRKPK